MAKRILVALDPMREILTEAESFGVDLISVTTSGRSGLQRAVLGSIAEQVHAPGH